MRKSMKRFAVAMSGVSLALSLGLVGCGQQQAQPTEAVQEEQAEQEDTANEAEEGAEAEDAARPFMGEKADGSWEILLNNGLDKEITELCLRPSGTTKWSANLLGTSDSSEAFAAGYEGYLLYLSPEKGAEVDKPVNYDVRVTMANGGKHRYSEVPLVDGDSVTLKFGPQTGVSFVKILRADGSEASTRKAALERKAAQQAKKAAEEEAKRAEEEAAATAATGTQNTEETYYEEDAYYEDGGYEEEYYEPEPEPYYEPEAAPAQSEEDCLGDDVVFKE